MPEKSQIKETTRIPLLAENNQPVIKYYDDYPTLADRNYVVKPVDGHLTGGAAKINNNVEKIPTKYTNMEMLLPYLSGEISTKRKLKVEPYAPYNYVNIDASEYNITFPEPLKDKLKEFLRKEEKLKLNAYKVGKDVWTIGYGHTKGVKPGDKITEEDAERFLDQDIDEHIKSLKIIKAPLSNNQKVAMASLAFNLGYTRFRKKDIVKYLNNYDYDNAIAEFNKLVFSANGIEPGLVSRRQREKELFLLQDY